MRWITIAAFSALMVVAGCAAHTSKTLRAGELQEMVRSHGYQWTGVAASQARRIFVCYPRWHDPHRCSVAEALPDGSARPLPDGPWNTWSPGMDVKDRFVCVQSVYVDAVQRLWALDAGSPRMEGVVPGAAKLVEINISGRRPVRTILFDETVAPVKSYLNDVRIDTVREVAYISDSGLGAIVVLDLKTGKARRVLEGHFSTQAEPMTITIDGREMRFPDGSKPVVHCDGIALDAKGEYLYYQALTGRTLYRVATDVLRHPDATPEVIEAAVTNMGTTVVTDGMIMDAHGNLYFSAIEQSAIMVRTPDGELRTFVADPRLAWPDSFAIARGHLYVSTAQIHRTPWFSGEKKMPASPYMVLRTGLAEAKKKE